MPKSNLSDINNPNPTSLFKTVFISLGANTPQKESVITATIDLLSKRFDNFICSDTYVTPCWRGDGDDYMNAVASFRTENSVKELESLFKDLEAKAGRIRDDRHRSVVPLDIDVVVYNNEVLRLRDFDRYYFIKGFSQIADPRKLTIDNYHYELPEERIAVHPLSERDKCKLLVCDKNGVKADSVFAKIGDFLPRNTLMVYNDTRVINARLRFAKPSGSVIEIFCLEPYSPQDYQLNFASTQPVEWKCLVGNSKRWKEGLLTTILLIGEKEITLTAERIQKIESESVIRFAWSDDRLSFSEIIAAAGEIPIPPYLNRNTEECDLDDYQTVYSRIEGSVAAPTAGLHFTDTLLEQLKSSGMKVRNVTLHVGAGTFRPVKTDDIGHHDMHAELIDVSKEFIKELAETERPVTAVGTTTVRTLESLYHIGCQIHSNKWEGHLDQWYAYSTDHPRLSVNEALMAIVDYLDKNNLNRLVTSTRIIIAPSYHYRIVKNLITNFHQPGSTLLLLVAAIVGDSWRSIYNYALDNSYRFLSYGDACLFLNL